MSTHEGSIDAGRVVRAARAWLGRPWAHQGRDPVVGVDCAGLVICVARELGLVDASFDVQGYGRVPDGSMRALCARWMHEVHELELGAVALMAVDPGADGERAAQHLGIVGDYRHGGHSLIHASGIAGRVIEHRVMWTRAMRLLGVYRLPGVVG